MYVRRAAIAITAVGALMLPAGTGASPEPPGSVAGSKEWMTSRWAHPSQGRAAVHARPAPHARKVASTHPLTEDGFPEVYLALRSHADSEGRIWIKIWVPMRPEGTKGWVRDSALGPLYRVRTKLVVDRSSLRATLYRDGDKVWGAPVGIGAPSTPTPRGHFWIREKFKTSGSGGIYGPVAFGTSAYSVLSDWPRGGVVGIHGTNEPSLIPGRPSHGCIRLRNDAAMELWEKMPIGTPVRVR